MTKLRPARPSPALIISIIALFLAMGGAGYAAFKVPKNSVGSKQLKKNSVGSKQLKKNAVTTPKIKNGAVTAAKLNTVGLTVPNANTANLARTLPAPTVQALPFGPGWGLASAVRAPAFSKDAQGYVHLQGGARRFVGTATLIGTLPAGFRPSASVEAPVATFGPATPGIVEIDAAGGIHLLLGQPDTVSLESITFKADQ